MQDIQRAWMDWLGQAVQISARLSQELFRYNGLPQIAEFQRSFLTESLKGWMEGSVRVLQATQRVSQDAQQASEQHRDDRSRRSNVA